MGIQRTIGILLLLLLCVVMPSCIQNQRIQTSTITSRIEIGMSRDSAVNKLGDALKHYECPGYGDVMDDLFFYDSDQLEKASVIYLQSKMVSNTLEIYAFGVIENYLLPAEYGSCLGLPKP